MGVGENSNSITLHANYKLDKLTATTVKIDHTKQYN